jgi:predicted RNA-binding protein YlqC (UPF0109 family)
LQDLLEFLARALVDEPDEVQVNSYEEDDGTLVLEVSVAADDVGMLIGRGGRTINAVRSVVRAASIRAEKRVLVDVVDPE